MPEDRDAPIEVGVRPARFPSFHAVVTLRGEHDIASASQLELALAGVRGDVLVDFTACTFCDSSVVRVLFEAARVRRRESRRLELLVPRGNAPVARIFQITGLATQATVREDLSDVTHEPDVVEV